MLSVSEDMGNTAKRLQWTGLRTRRRRQALLTAAVAAVHAPGVAEERRTPQRAHAIDQQQRVRLAARLAHP